MDVSNLRPASMLRLHRDISSVFVVCDLLAWPQGEATATVTATAATATATTSAEPASEPTFLESVGTALASFNPFGAPPELTVLAPSMAATAHSEPETAPIAIATHTGSKTATPSQASAPSVEAPAVVKKPKKKRA